EFKTIIVEKELKDAIGQVVKQNAIDVIVMGTKGATGTVEYLMGSNTVKVVKGIKDCSVLIVSKEQDFVVPKQIVFPTDFNHFYGEELKPLKQMADLFNAKIRVVNISTGKELSCVQNYNMAALENYLADYNYSFHWLPDYTKKAEAITTFIEDF